nr:MAG TPA: hypothetical protein [Caudoviricetes sp.]DAY31018.1 MAG TPA: hypothetical protein [Caudoviricetes sp.]
MQTNLEEMTEEYSLACAKAVRDTIHALAEKWGNKVVDELNEQGYNIWVELLGGEMVVRACVCKGDYWTYKIHDNADIQREAQAALDTLNVQVVLNAMIKLGLENVNQVTRWRIY